MSAQQQYEEKQPCEEDCFLLQFFPESPSHVIGDVVGQVLLIELLSHDAFETGSELVTGTYFTVISCNVATDTFRVLMTFLPRVLLE